MFLLFKDVLKLTAEYLIDIYIALEEWRFTVLCVSFSGANDDRSFCKIKVNDAFNYLSFVFDIPLLALLLLNQYAYFNNKFYYLV